MTEISTPAIIAENISKTFNPLSKSPVPALKDISFRVEKGEIVGLIGPNGAGKTTLLRILLGFLNADSGRVTILGEPTASLDPPSVFQLRDFLALRKKSHTTVFFSSHNLTEVEHVCDRVLFINQGAIVGEYKLKRLRRGFLEKAFRRHLVEGKSS